MDLTQLSGRGTDRARTDRRQLCNRRPQLNFSDPFSLSFVTSYYNNDDYKKKSLPISSGVKHIISTTPRNETARPGKRLSRNYSVQQKLDAIKRVREGKSKAAVARDIDAPESTLRGWCKSEHKLQSQAGNLRNFEQEVSPSSNESKRSSPSSSSPFVSNMPANDVNIAISFTAPTEPSPAVKRLRVDNEITPAINIGAQAARVAPVTTSSDVGLIENGLQYTRNNGVLTNNATKEKHSTSFLMPDTPRNSIRQNSSSPAMDSPGTSRTNSTSLINGTQADPSISKKHELPKNVEQITASLGPLQYLQPGQTRNTQLDAMLLQWNMVQQLANINALSTRKYNRELLDYIFYNNNNNNLHQNNNNQSSNNTENDNGVQPPSELQEAIEHGNVFVNWLQSRGTPISTFVQVNEIKKILSNMKQMAQNRE
ncbi:hypothetical protein DMN91_007645 [Ooceraea biroi]|uniref:Protein distal antenna n=1 Tax=Ooceraea biroi TaxID=2015173 RepID=A0A026WXC4_OOCBI|nr:protein distal antenna-like [Ooceraea biroi]EZA60667.1 Protein distal antenna [Ooceraea biroi]RLU21029.1 hypothetical protein DMN91_007645 [Ooceraea biroi]